MCECVQLKKIKDKEMDLSWLKKELWSGKTNITLKDKFIGPEGAKVIEEALTSTDDSVKISKLDLCGSYVGDEGLKIIGNALRHSKTLTDIELENQHFSVEDAKAIGEALKENKNLTEVDLISNYISSDAELIIEEALLANHSLTHLNLCGTLNNNISISFQFNNITFSLSNCHFFFKKQIMLELMVQR